MTLTQPVPQDRRRFEAEYPNDLWQSDCMHGPSVEHQNKRRKTARRRVAKDRTISLNGKVFSAPVELIGKQVTLLYHDENPEQLEIKVGDKSYAMAAPVDLHVNCRVRRDKYRNVELHEADEPKTYKGGSLWGKGENS
jgi:hypothetical protein